MQRAGWLVVFLVGCSGGGGGDKGSTVDTLPTLGSYDSGAEWDPDERLAGCGDPVQEMRGRSDCGDLIFEDHCAICHGAFGTGSGIGTDLTVAVSTYTDAEILAILTDGKGADMPPAVVPPPGYAHVLAYLRKEFGEYRRQ